MLVVTVVLLAAAAVVVMVVMRVTVAVQFQSPLLPLSLAEPSAKDIVRSTILGPKESGPALELDGSSLCWRQRRRPHTCSHPIAADIAAAAASVVVELVLVGSAFLALADKRALADGLSELANHVFDFETYLFPVRGFGPPIVLGVPDQISSNGVAGWDFQGLYYFPVLGGGGPLERLAFLKNINGQLLRPFDVGSSSFSTRSSIVFVFVSVIVIEVPMDHSPELSVTNVGTVRIPLSKQNILGLRALDDPGQWRGSRRF